jgi:hypothetical protein
MPTNEKNRLKNVLGSVVIGAVENVELLSKAGRPAQGDNRAWDKERNYRTSLVMDPEQHNAIKRLANKTGVTFKQTMYLLLDEGLRRVESGELEIVNTREG